MLSGKRYRGGVTLGDLFFSALLTPELSNESDTPMDDGGKG